MFCGHIFASSNDALISHAANPNTVEKLEIQYAVFDEIYAAVKIIELYDFDGTIPADWTFDTRFHAIFNDTLYGGNVNFTESIVDSIRIKKRTARDNKFKTIFERKIEKNDDLSVELIDYFEPVGMVEYAYVPVISGGENNYIISKVESDFDDFFLCEKDKSYPLILDAFYTQTINYETSQVKPFGRKYPVTVINGSSGYKSGEMECLFVQFDQDSADTDHAFHYRNLIYEMLINGKPKILKDSEGKLLLVNVTGSISESDRQYLYGDTGGFYYVKSKFSWTECGDAYEVGDLYDNGLIDTDLDR